MRSRIYTIRGCTIEVPKGGQSATVKKPGKEPVEFENIADGPTAEVQATRFAMGLDVQNWKHSEVEVAVPMIANATLTLEADESTDLDEATDGE